MTEQPSAAIPEWTLGDRLRKAREHARLKQSELADDIGISRASVVNYESGRYEPSRPVLLSWALRSGVDLAWLAGSDRRPRGRGRVAAPAARGFNKLGKKTPFPQVSGFWGLAA